MSVEWVNVNGLIDGVKLVSFFCGLLYLSKCSHADHNWLACILFSQESEELNKKRSHSVQRKIDARKESAKIDPLLDDQFITGRLYGTSSHWRYLISGIMYASTYNSCPFHLISSHYFLPPGSIRSRRRLHSRRQRTRVLHQEDQV